MTIGRQNKMETKSKRLRFRRINNEVCIYGNTEVFDVVLKKKKRLSKN